MKKNWLPILLCLGFILAWQILVVGPYNQKHPAAPQVVETKNSSPVTSAQSTQGAAPFVQQGAAPNVSGHSAVVGSISLPPARSAKIFQNGAIGAAEFHDYR